MAKSGQSRAEANREIRREALREQLANKGLLQHVIEISEKLEDLSIELQGTEVQRLSKAAELKLALVKKYLPDIKSVELTGDDGEPIKLDASWTVLPVKVKDA